MEAVRRKRGVVAVKGTLIACVVCGGDVVLNRNADAKYCKPCALEKTRAASRKSSALKRQTPEGREYLNSWHRDRHKADPAWRIAAHMRVMLHRAFGKGKAGRSWREFVPYTLNELVSHLERQFTKGMSREKLGSEIHVDHIRPLSSFRYTSPTDPEFAEAWALSNLRPMWALDNIKKNSTRTHLI